MKSKSGRLGLAGYKECLGGAFERRRAMGGAEYLGGIFQNFLAEISELSGVARPPSQQPGVRS